MFDTPVAVPALGFNEQWWRGLPTFEEYQEKVLAIQPQDLVETMRNICTTRNNVQSVVAEQRLGKIDGQNAKLIAQSIKSFMQSSLLDYLINLDFFNIL